MMMLELRNGFVPRVVAAAPETCRFGHSFTNAAARSGLPRSTSFGVNGVSFSYSAISAFQQNDDNG